MRDFSLFTVLVSCALALAGLLFLFKPDLIISGVAPEAEFKCEHTGMFVVSDTIYVCGIIDAENSLDNLFYSAQDIKKVVVNSGGGTSEDTIALARSIMSNGWSLEIFSLCLSSCAHFLLPSRQDVVVSPGALVGFHHTQTAIALAAESYFGTITELMKDRMNMEIEYYQELGVDPSFLSAPYANMDKTSFSFDPMRGDEYAYSVAYKNENLLLLDLEVVEQVFHINLIGSTRMRNLSFGDRIQVFENTIATFVPVLDLNASISGRTDRYCIADIQPIERRNTNVVTKHVECVELN